MNLTISHHNHTVVVTIEEERLDMQFADEFGQKLLDLIQQGHRTLIINLKNVTLLDSKGIGAIMAAFQALGEQGELVLCGIRDTIKKLLQLTRIDQILRCFDKLEDALENV